MTPAQASDLTEKIGRLIGVMEALSDRLDRIEQAQDKGVERINEIEKHNARILGVWIAVSGIFTLGINVIPLVIHK